MMQKKRILGAKLARELSKEEQSLVAGGGGLGYAHCGGACTLPDVDDNHL